MNQAGLSADLCLKCNICTAACPVAAVTDRFPGPKAVGPQLQRFRSSRHIALEGSVEWCSGCGTCSSVCPHGVAGAEINIQAKARQRALDPPSLRDKMIARPELLGRLARPMAPIANLLTQSKPSRWLLERSLHISRHAPLPRFARRTLRQRNPSRISSSPPRVADRKRPLLAYFHGCSANYYEPELGETAIAVLDALGFEVVLPPQRCCGLPLQSNGLFEPARAYAQSNIRSLRPFAEADLPIIGASTSCTLSLKHDYRAILGLEGDEVDLVAESTFDIFEFLSFRHPSFHNETDFAPVSARALYHAPCQLRSHGIGAPALEALRRIPALHVVESSAACCGIAGTYGVKQEKYDVARAVGAPLFAQAAAEAVDFIITDSETCRWWISEHTRLPAFHPIEILARSMGLA